MKKSVFGFIIITFISASVFSQNKCFENYEVPDIPKNTADLRTAFDERFHQFEEIIKDCRAPDFKVATIEGDTIELKKLKGKVVVINFWFIECAPCIAEIPALNKLTEEYESNDVVFIAMSRDTKKAFIDEFLPKHTFKFRIVPDCKNLIEIYKIT